MTYRIGIRPITVWAFGCELASLRVFRGFRSDFKVRGVRVKALVRLAALSGVVPLRVLLVVELKIRKVLLAVKFDAAKPSMLVRLLFAVLLGSAMNSLIAAETAGTDGGDTRPSFGVQPFLNEAMIGGANTPPRITTRPAATNGPTQRWRDSVL